MQGTSKTRRGGFSLIELLVVMSVIAVIAALAGVALFGTTESQRRNSTDQQKALDSEYQNVIAQSEREVATGAVPPAFTQFSETTERARVIWTAAQLRRNFPDTFRDAVNGVAFQVNGVTIHNFTPLATFTGHNPALTPTAMTHEESAALLYIILTKKSSSGGGSTAGSGDELGPTRDVPIGNASFKTFVDSWGNSVGFRRWDRSDELQRAEYAPGTGANKDPLDPKSLVFAWADTGKRAQIQAAAVNWFYTDGRNRRPLVYSTGKDKAVGTADDQLGTRLLRLGAKGKQ
jgi:prepilin-type N-terminal cleavage/methylation domain-containing protein